MADHGHSHLVITSPPTTHPHHPVAPPLQDRTLVQMPAPTHGPTQAPHWIFKKEHGETTADLRLLNSQGSGLTAHYDHSDQTHLSHAQVCLETAPPAPGLPSAEYCHNFTWGHETTGAMTW